MQIFKNEAYLLYAAMTKDAAQRRYWTFCGIVNFSLGKGMKSMEPLISVLDYLFRDPAPSPGFSEGKPAADEKPAELPSDWDAHLVCVQCLQIITNPANRISVDGAHLHTFANPHGIVFEIGCFGAAPGCGTTGPATDDFSWFKGYQWKIALCRRCLSHMGWQFISGAGLFYGLISDRLMELKIDNLPS